MHCNEKFRLALFVAYVISTVSALANPADMNYEDAYQLMQGANIITLLVLAYCKSKMGDVLIAALLGVAFTMRATGTLKGGSRWDSLLVTVGMLFILQDAFYQIVPKSVPHRYVLYLGFSCLIMPVLSTLPYLVQPSTIDRETLLEAAHFSGQAYQIPKDNTSLLGPLWTLYDADTDTSAGVNRALNAQGSYDVYVYFKGSESAKNWQTNINILDEPVPSDWGCTSGTTMRTHKGYNRAFNSVAKKLLVALENEMDDMTETTRVIVTGHSLGGALATLAAVFIACKLPRLRPRMTVVTFGAPQVGDGNFVAFYNKIVPKTVRVVNPADPVPRLLNVQLVHVEGYFPVGTLSLKSFLNPHDLAQYTAAVDKTRWVSIASAFAPAAVVAIVIGAYITWQLRS